MNILLFSVIWLLLALLFILLSFMREERINKLTTVNVEVNSYKYFFLFDIGINNKMS